MTFPRLGWGKSPVVEASADITCAKNPRPARRAEICHHFVSRKPAVSDTAVRKDDTVSVIQIRSGEQPVAEVAIIGGSGFYELLDDAAQVSMDTPWGAPSAPVAVGRIGDRNVAFLPRHGAHHELPPHRVNYRANLWALRQLGVQRVFGPCAVGSLRGDLVPGGFVVPDQLVDLTNGRPDTYLDQPGRPVEHVSFADPYCPELRNLLGATGIRRGGTVVVISGPRFATRAESAWYRAQGWDVINMTQYPEAYLARELGMCYACLALVTDHDTGCDDDPTIEPVTMEAVLEVLAANVDRARRLLLGLIADLPVEPACACRGSGARQLQPEPAASSIGDTAHR
jgi:5'-methylthioadenosine phosphorylase